MSAIIPMFSEPLLSRRGFFALKQVHGIETGGDENADRFQKQYFFVRLSRGAQKLNEIDTIFFHLQGEYLVGNCA